VLQPGIISRIQLMWTASTTGLDCYLERIAHYARDNYPEQIPKVHYDAISKLFQKESG